MPDSITLISDLLKTIEAIVKRQNVLEQRLNDLIADDLESRVDRLETIMRLYA